jgi:hypothetical protein
VPTALSLQPLTVELWIEKESAALEAEVLPVAQSFGVRVVVGVGFQSEVAAANLVQRSLRDGRDRLVLWLADADASGESMAIATARHAEFLCGHWLALHQPETIVPRILCDRVALTLDQLAGIQASIGRTIPLSPDVAREEGRVELQALAAFAPGWVADELKRRLREVTDLRLWAARDAWQEEAEAAVEEAWTVATEPLRQRLAVLERNRDEILARYQITFARADLRALDPERQRIEAEYDALAESFAPDLPEPPQGSVDLDGRDWLLDTERGYVEQLNAYRRHEPVHRRRPPLDLVERACATCGGSLAGKKAGAIYCDKCRHRRGGR